MKLGYLDADEIREAIDSHASFSVKQKCIDGFEYLVADYIFQAPDTFTGDDGEIDPVKREIRGLIMNTDHEVVSRRYHKFFNLGEHDFTYGVLSRSHHVLDKLDGSMVSGLVLPDGRIFYSTMNMADLFHDRVEAFVSKSDRGYERLVRDLFDEHYTAIFEWLDPEDPIVIKYPERELILTGIRHLDGSYIPVEEMIHIAKEYGVPVVDVMATDVEGDFIESEFYREHRDRNDMEGFVIRDDRGEMTKVKLEIYSNLHVLVTNFTEKKAIKLIMEDNVDDVVGYLSMTETRPDIVKYLIDLQKEFHAFVDRKSNEIVQIVTSRKEYGRKELAMEFVNKHPFFHVIMAVRSAMENGDDVRRVAIDKVREHVDMLVKKNEDFMEVIRS